MIIQTKTYVIWIFFMLWKGEGHEDWSFIKFLGLVLTTVAVVQFLQLEAMFKETEHTRAEEDSGLECE